jgi:hypothetical protein
MEGTTRDTHHENKHQSICRCLCFEWLINKLIIFLLNFNIIFGAILILLCGAAQSGSSMLLTVMQGVFTVLGSSEILTDIRKLIMPKQKVKYFFLLSLSFGLHYIMLEESTSHLNEKCSQLCEKYFNEIAERQQLNVVYGSKDSTDNNFNSMRDCELRCTLSNDLYKYMIVLTGLMLFLICMLIRFYDKISSEFITPQEMLSQRKKLKKRSSLEKKLDKFKRRSIDSPGGQRVSISRMNSID